ncbi:P-loop containing nucleoside triphosphate hydrolase protein [Sphaerosporella brunnea]|uniref:P-loop containing nucleoside triphosphate hydrolase protein n=1 Tax=Sphaerosporella brunnea TaxID=1250544 RepID=A0A5J5EHT4_9PEZI|nr:P-loop containing nucleoside triphosphate hydrolase protein [Sphaerosporella brunnea]
MCDLPSVLPDYNPPNPRLQALFETHNLSTAELLFLDAIDISRRCTTPHSVAPSLLEIKRYITHLSSALNGDIAHHSGPEISTQSSQYLTTGDETLDTLLNGGVRVGGITEFVGESGAGKTQFLLTLLLTCQLPSSQGGLGGRGAVYISTESPLSTPRLVQISRSLNSRLSPSPKVSTDKVLSITCNDLETQEHILKYQLPTAVARHNIGLIVLDSIAANFRAELDRPAQKRQRLEAESNSGPALLARRGGELVRVAQGLRELARRHNLAVVVANQVSDRFSMDDAQEEDPWSLDYQSRWFTGWEGRAGGKVPALGMVWANVLAARVVLRKADEDRGRRRRVGVVFAGWAEGGREMDLDIWEGGVRAVKEEKEDGVDGVPNIYG